MTYQLKGVRPSPASRHDVILEVEHCPGWLLRVFGAKPHIVEYVGFSAVWRRVPDMERMPTYFEIMLSQFHEWHKWQAAKGGT